MTLIYNYDDDGNFINSQVALVDEFGKEILPENATYLKPLEEKEGYKVKFDGEKWIYEEIPQPKEPTLDELKEAKRAERDRILAETDVKMLPDFPISEEEKGLWIKYRQYLRDLPESADFPNVEVITFEDWNK